MVLNPILVSDGHSWKYYVDENDHGVRTTGIHGIDISRYNSEINWQLINAGKLEKDQIKFVFIKATEGIDLIDEKYVANWQNAQNHNFTKGAYHFYVPSKDPILQAQNFIKVLKLIKGDLPPVLDFETWGNTIFDQKTIIKNVKIWLDVVESNYGVRPIIYTNKHILKKLLEAGFENYPIWLSDFSVDKLENEDYCNLNFWQYSDSGSINGINAPVDLNVFLGSKFQFDKLLIQ